jgi:hypothetical protein
MSEIEPLRYDPFANSGRSRLPRVCVEPFHVLPIFEMGRVG